MSRPSARLTIPILASAALAAAVLGPVAGRSVLAPPAPDRPGASEQGEASVPAPPAGGAWDEAGRYRDEGSWARALEILVAIEPDTLSEDDRRWRTFLIADGTWRSLASTPQSEDTALEAARETLARLADGPPFDRLHAEALESLGDFHWMRREANRWDLAWPRYAAALERWAASRDLDLARERYLGIVRKACRRGVVPAWWRAGWRPDLPADVVENAARIARSADDVALTRYLLAGALRRDVSTPARYDRAIAAYDDAVRAAAGHEWLDDALWEAAQLRLAPGRPTPAEGGTPTWTPDYNGAVRILNDLLARFAEGDSRYVPQARRTVAEILDPAIGVHVAQAFLPGSPVDVHVTWRNVTRIDFALYAVDPLRDLARPDGPNLDLAEAIDLDAGGPIATWSEEHPESRDHAPRDATRRLERALEAGTYVLEVRAGSARARALIPVTRTAAVLWLAEGGAAVHVADALDGTPIEAADVAVWEGRSDHREWSWSVRRAVTDADGLVRLPLASDARSIKVVAVVGRNGEHAVAESWAYGRTDAGADVVWALHVFPDRPAYRPGETVRFKTIARIRERSGALSTPVSRALAYRVTDARGGEIARGTLAFNAFGGAWAEHALPEGAALGDAVIELTDPAGGGRTVGVAVLCGIEEYRLPEFRVDVRAPEDDAGRPRTFRPGETIEIDVAASYYFGGPVVGAAAEIVVRRSPRYVRWHAPRPYAWLTDEATSFAPPYGAGQEVVRTATVLDADGRARVSVPTAMTEQADWTYTIEARVTDAARREVSGAGTFQVTRQPYFAFLEPDHRLLRPRDRARIAVRAIDGNDRSVEAEGRIRVTREVWTEVWVDPWGREVTGETLTAAKRRVETFPPPPPDPDGPSWRLAFRGYRTEEIAQTTLRVTPDGPTEWSFVPEREGFYRIAWSSEPDALWPVRAETTVWVTTFETRSLGYRPGGLEIVVDRDAFRVGEDAVAMLVSPVPEASILFAVEPGGIDALRAIRMRGDVELVRIPLDAGHAPNVWLHAAAVREAGLAVDRRSVPVAPADRAFDVEVTLDGDEHRPGSEGRARVRAVDLDGNPVEAEVALAVYDEAVEAIRPDRAGDPRTAFLSGSRGTTVRVTSSFAWRRYVTLSDDDGNDRAYQSVVGGVAANELKEEGAFVADLPAEGAAFAKRARPEAEADMMAPRADAQLVAGADTVQVRTDFRATAAWVPAIVTGPGGTGETTFRWPESLTSWKAVARAAGRDARFGYGTSAARTTKPLTVRLQTPRFLVAGDRAIVSAVLNNRTDRALAVRTDLDADGVVVGSPDLGGAVTIEPGGEARIEWPVDAAAHGTAAFTVRARAEDVADASDGMVRAIPIVEHGVAKLVARSGRVRGGETTVTFDLPRERREGSTTLAVAIAPSIAVAALDALPYLIDYPYGCTEQTLSRFVPAVVVRRTLSSLGLEPAEIEGRMFGGIEPEHAAAVQGDREPALSRLDEVVRQGLARLVDFQHGDGGWGWWKDGDSDPFLTAYALWGLSEASAAGVDVDRARLRRAADFLDRNLVRAEDDPDLAAWMLHALAAEAHDSGNVRPTGPRLVAFERAYDRREALGAYGKALLALAAHRFGRGDEATVLVRNLENGVIRDDRPDRSGLVAGGPRGGGAAATAHWGPERMSWRWADGPVETTAFALRALLAIRPDHELVEPAVTWLVENRRGAQWRHTRETAIAVLALTDRIAARRAAGGDGAFRVEVNGRVVGEGEVRPEKMLAAPMRFAVDPAALRDGKNRVRIARTAGEGPLYFAIEAEYFSLEEPVSPAGHRVFVAREYLVRAPYPTLLAGTRFDLVPLPDEGTVGSGDRVEVVVTVEAKNDLEYLVFEDLKPAGLEAVDVASGGGIRARRLRAAAAMKPAVDRVEADYTGESRSVYRELRDRRIASFVDRLPEGFWEIRYELRAETPGTFHGLPVLAHAMYAPEIRANGAEHRVTVEDR